MVVPLFLQRAKDSKEGTTGHGTTNGKETPKGNAPKGSGGVKPDGRTLLGGTATGKHDEEAAKEGGNTGEAVELPEKEEMTLEAIAPENTRANTTGNAASENDKKLETKDFGNTETLRGDHADGVKVNINVYANVNDSMIGKETTLTLHVAARHKNSLYLIAFNDISVYVELRNYQKIDWFFIEILETVTAESKAGKAVLEKGKIYRIQPTKTNHMKKTIISLCVCIFLTTHLLGQNKNGWYYQKETIKLLDKYYSNYYLTYYKNELLLEKQKYKSAVNTERLSSAAFYKYNSEHPESFSYVWYVYRDQLYLSSIHYNPDNIDSSYNFHIDGVSLYSIRYNKKYNLPEKEYKLGERYFFDFPSPTPDTLPAFFEKVKEGCPYTACTVISTDEGDKEQGEGSGK